MNRPIISMTILTEPACKAQPKQDMQAPVKTVIFRPSRSPVKALMIVPRIAPPWNAETTPPVVLSSGLEKYSMNLGCPIVEVTTPLSYPNRNPIGNPHVRFYVSSKSLGVLELPPMAKKTAESRVLIFVIFCSRKRPAYLSDFCQLKTRSSLYLANYKCTRRDVRDGNDRLETQLP